MPKKSKPAKKKSTSKKKKGRGYKKPTIKMLGNFDTLTGGVAGAGAKQSNQSDGTGVPATKAAAMPE